MTTPPLSRRARSALFKALRAAFRAVPMKESTRDMLRSRFLREFPTVRPLPAQGQVSSTYERRPRVRADERCIGYVEYSEEPLPDPLPATLVAFYLPQFHTIPENDEWWGKGFTEWRNVTRALPQFEGHLQPRLPGDLGFYDLRNPQVMRDQAKLAKTYGLSAFCFYFYWFGGKTLLEEPLRNWLNDKSIDFQYCLCWANENWTRRWDGREDDVLIAQKHSPEDDIAFIEYVADYLRDPRYLRVDGKPMLLLYRPMLLPDPKATAERWRTWCRENDIGEIHLAYVQSFERPTPQEIAFDAAVEFPPNNTSPPSIARQQRLLNPNYSGDILDWRAPDTRVSIARPRYRVHSGVDCGWDNEPRRPGRGRTLLHANPCQLARRLRGYIARTPTDQPIFINAWNEWAEGAVLEPDRAHGHAWLAAVRNASRGPRAATSPIALIHAWYPDILSEILDALSDQGTAWRFVITTSPPREAAIREVLARHGVAAEIRVNDNVGRDILPTLSAAASLIARGEGDTAVLKLHTKRSPHADHGDVWRRQLVEQLSGSAPEITARFDADAQLGAVVLAPHLQPITAFEGDNRPTLDWLARIAGLTIDEKERFPAGSMYWMRPSALASLVHAPLTAAAFGEEDERIDGTLAHAIERAILPTVRASGFRYEVIGTLIPPDRYPHAVSARG